MRRQENLKYNHVYLIRGRSIDEALFQQALLGIREILDVSVVSREIDDSAQALKEEDLLFVLVSDAEFRVLWQRLADRPLYIAPLPHGDNPLTQQYFQLNGSLRKCIQRTQQETPPIVQQQLSMDDELLLSSVRIGNSPQIRGRSWWGRMLAGLRYLRWAHPYPMRLRTAKKQVVDVAALFIDVGEESQLLAHQSWFGSGSEKRGRAAALIYSPKSLVAFFRLLLLRQWPGKRSALPDGVGKVASHALEVTALQKDLPSVVEGRRVMFNSARFQCRETRCRVVHGMEVLNSREKTEKESIRVQGVPASEDEMDYFIKRRLPLFPIASEQAFADLFTLLRKNARLSSVFATLMLLSSVLATLGLMQGSAPVIIGAMILAPLMAPIVSLSMGLLRFDSTLIEGSGKTLTAGVVMAIGLAALFAWWLPFEHYSQEITARINPNLLDLGVAIVSGIAAAYAYSREDIAKSLAGVAIAVALVPPLNVAGIGLGRMDWLVFQGAFLLFLTNLVGIVAAAGVTFYTLGFASLRYARVAFLYKLVLLALISLPLAYSTAVLIDEDDIYRRFRAVSVEVLADKKPIAAQLLEVRSDKRGLIARVRLQLPVGTSQNVIAEIARQYSQRLEVNVELEPAFYSPHQAKGNR